MRFDIITIFPEICEAYIRASMIKRAEERGLIACNVHNLRDYAEGKHKKVDERPYGGGPGMLMSAEPIVKAVERIAQKKNNKKNLVVIFTPSGKQFTNDRARVIAKRYTQVIGIAGRYEGIDARVKKILKAQGHTVEEYSIGPYVLTGGELPALVVLDAVTRQIPGALGKGESLEEKRLGIGVPAYTRPEVIVYKKKKYAIPRVLQSGHHKKITAWRASHQVKHIKKGIKQEV